jgi:hypothetical protein
MMMRKLLIWMFAVLLMFAFTATGFAAAFVDMPADHWAYDAVIKLAKANLIEGYSDGTFRGDKAMSRYEVSFLVARAIEKYEVADAGQKKLIDKLSIEFATELNKMGIRMAKVETKTNSWVSGGDMRFRYHVNAPKTPGSSKLGSADNFDWRGRIRFSGQLNDNWTATARIASPWSNRFGNSDGNVGSVANIDVFNMKGANILGFDSVKIGRDSFAAGHNMISKSASVDGIWLNDTLAGGVFMGFVGNTKQATGGKANTLSLGQFTWKPQKDLRFGVGYYWADIPGTSKTDGTGDLMADNGAQFDSSRGYDLFFAYDMSKMTLLGEYIGSTLQNPVNMPGSPKGWSVQLSNGSGPSSKAFFGNTPMTNPKKIGDTAWLVGYRRVQSGTTPVSLGGFDQMAVASPSQAYNVFTHGTDNVKGWTFSLETVPDKNITLNLTVQKLSIVNRGLTQKLTSDDLDTTTVFTANYWF